MPKYDCSLWTYLKTFQKPIKNKLHIEERIFILKKIILAVEEIQSKEMCHYDLKPSNILLKLKNGEIDRTSETSVVLTDFGLAAKNESQIKNAGTPGFGSPEQFFGQGHRKSSQNLISEKIHTLCVFFTCEMKIVI